MTIKKVAVIGSGVMGSGIAAHCANAGCEVLLLDIVLEGKEDRNYLSNSAITNIQKSNPEMLMHKSYINRIRTGNVEDDISKLSNVDWVIEVIIEDLDSKKILYSNIAEYLGPETILSSNTSTLPRSSLVSNMPRSMASKFLITHFFNPPRYLPLLEVITSSEVDYSVVERLSKFAEFNLGKNVILCNDTPGFIGNRLGIFFTQRALKATLEYNLTVEQADSMLGRPLGIPKTAVFGLMDLVGIDLIPYVMDSMLKHLPEKDPFHDIAGSGREIIDEMISSGFTGRKGKGGFYRLNRDGKRKIKEFRNLSNGDYSPLDKNSNFISAKLGKQGISAVLDFPDKGAKFASDVLIDTLAYAAYIVPEVSDDIHSIDQAMKVGYNWKKGPFEIMDSIGISNIISRLKSKGKNIPELLLVAQKNGSFYSEKDGDVHRIFPEGHILPVVNSENKLTVSDLKRRKKPILKNPSASIWDLDDQILLIEYHTKMNAVDPLIIEMLENGVKMAESGDWKGIVIGNDATNFCAGANLGLVLFAINLSAWKDVEDFIKAGQEAYKSIKFCKVPVVAAPSGMCLGGGAEILLHCDSLVAHSESYIGLVEVGVGIIPAWGGCKELIGRLRDYKIVEEGPMPPVMKAFEYIGTAQVSKSAEQARSMAFLSPQDKIVMNRNHLLYEAKQKALELSEGYKPPESREYNLPGPSGRVALELAVKDLILAGKATPHDEVVTKELSWVLSGGDNDILQTVSEDEILLLEREAIGRLGRNEKSLDRMENMLKTGKPLRN